MQLKPLSSGADLTSGKADILDYIEQASAMITLWTQRTFVPYVASDMKMLYEVSPYSIQELPDDTLSVTSLADTSGTVLDADNYRFRDIYNRFGGHPYRYVEIARGVGFATQDSNNFARTWSISGIFGYSNRSYANSWLTATTLNMGSGLADNVTSVTVTSGATLETGATIRMGAEFMQVTNIAANVITVRRGVNGSTATPHDNATPILIWQVHDSVKLACTRLAGWLYQSRKSELQSVQFQDGTVASANYPMVVRNALTPLVKPHFSSVI